MVEHVLKCWPAFFDAVARGEKNFEVRRDDCGFQKGDILVLQRTREDSPFYVDCGLDGKPKHVERRRVLYVLSGGQFGIEGGYVVMALSNALAGDDNA